MKWITSRKLLLWVVLLGLVSVCLGFSYRTILTHAGTFLAPEEIGKADVVIVEGSELIREDPVKIGMELLSSGRATRMVIVVHQDPSRGRALGLPSYSRLVIKDLEALGLQKNQFEVIEVPTNHPITLTEARIVLANLSRKGARSAILIAEGFHARRSFWAYKQAGAPFGIHIIPRPYFTYYRADTWWLSVDGWSEYITESFKFFYYIIMGYIPVKSLFAT